MTFELLHRMPARTAQQYPFRRTFIVGEALISVAGLGGAWQLVTQTYVPDVAVLAPIGLESWTLPGLWLFATTAAPAGTAAWLAWRRSDRTPSAVLVASGLLALELLVQIPFLGVHPLQAVFGVPAVALAALASRARKDGWGRP